MASIRGWMKDVQVQLQPLHNRMIPDDMCKKLGLHHEITTYAHHMLKFTAKHPI